VRLSDKKATEQNQRLSIRFNQYERHVVGFFGWQNPSGQFALRSSDCLTDGVRRFAPRTLL
jgi:hypothetical protein